MNRIRFSLGAVAIFVLHFHCHALGLEGRQVDPKSSTPPPANPLPVGCEFEVGSIPVGSIPSYTPPHPTVSQKYVPYASVVADAPVGRLRRVSFRYHFSGLQNIVPPNFKGGFKITSTQVTLFEGPTVAYGKASSMTFNDGAGNVMLPNTSVTEGPNGFQDLWTLRVESTGSLGRDSAQKTQPNKVTFLCSVPVTINLTSTPTMKQ